MEIIDEEIEFDMIVEQEEPDISIDMEIEQFLKGDKGDKGDKGEPGENGIQGIQGEQGIQGFSAYEIAVQNGFEGTEQEWLVSLKGPKGDTGPSSIEEDEIKILFEELLLEKDKQKYPIGKIEFNTTGENPSIYLGFGTWEQWGRGRVPVGVNLDDTDFETAEKIGGEKKVTLTLAQIPSHSHTFTGSKHTHSFSATSGNQSANHTHTIAHTHNVNINTNDAGGHTHDIYDNSYGAHARFAGFSASQGSTKMFRPAKDGLTDNENAILKITTAGTHKHNVNGSTGGSSAANTGSNSASHTHSVSGTTGEATQGGTVGNAGSGEAHNNLQPYITCYMWKRVA